MIYFHNFNEFLLYSAKAGSYELSFTEYVKSQLHESVIVKSKGRSLLPYGKAYKYLVNSDKYTEDVLTCLRYFYEDLLEFSLKAIREGVQDVRLYVKVEDPKDRINRFDVNIDSIEEELTSYLNSQGNKSTYAKGVFSLFTLEELSIVNPGNLLAVASVFHTILSGNSITKVRW